MDCRAAAFGAPGETVGHQPDLGPAIERFVRLAQTVPLAQLLPWLGLGPLVGVWALRPLWRAA